jgi:hypothetical protein
MSAVMNTQGQPSATGAPDGDTTGDTSTDQGFTVCISAMPDGTYSIYAQDSDDDQESNQAGAGATAGDTSSSDDAASGDDDSTQTADNVDDALAIAKQMLEQEAGEDDESGQDGSDMMSPADAKKAWNQMAAKNDKKKAGM